MLEIAISVLESGFLFITLTNFYLIISVGEIQLDKHLDLAQPIH